MDAARERERTSAVELERKEDALRDSQERELDALREEHRQRMRDEEKSGGGGGGDDDDSSGSAAQVVSLQKDATTVMPADNTIATVPVDNVAVVVPTDNAGGAQKTPPWPPKEDSQKELDLVDLDKVVGVEGGHQKVLLNDSKAIGNTIMASKDVANTMALVSANNATAVVPADNGAADNGAAVVPMGNTAGAQNMSSQPQKKESQKELHLDFDKVYAAKGGIQMVGGKFIEHYKTPKKAAKNIPPVEVKFKVRRLSDWDSKAGTFYVDCLLMLDWEDPSLSRATDSENPDFADHFWPQAEMEGVTPGGGDEPDWENTKPKYKPKFEDDKNKTGKVICHRATITIKYKMVLFARCNFREYPFDHQTLEISIKLLSVRIPFYIKGGVRPVAKHPTMRKKHQLIKDCDCLPEYDFVRLSSRAYSSKYGPFISKVDEDDFRKDEKKGKLYQDMYTLQVVMVRDSVSVMWNMCFSLFVIDVMVFAAHGIPMGDLADRMSVNLTLLLTAMAFKWVLSDQLPPVPYLTTMEKYVIMTFFCLWLQGVNFWFLADFYNYRCNRDEDTGEATKTDWWTGAEYSENRTVVIMDTSCGLLQRVDRSILIIEFLALIAKNGWFLYRIWENRVAKIKAETHYINLGGLDEFSMQEDMEFSGPDKHGEQMVDPQFIKTDKAGEEIQDDETGPDEGVKKKKKTTTTAKNTASVSPEGP